ncbi:MAG TPA: crotonyl-CoA carboxylase/reductase, partial [Actinomycetes bacterium]|nr:crotonyl-CoA carboxylase/reductase [Actinomycetes bacterium]
MKDILETILGADATPADYAALPVPEHYRGITVRQAEVGMFEGRTSRDKDPRESLHLDEVPTPE